MTKGYTGTGGYAGFGVRERGAVLLVALLILIIISVIGIAAMRTSLFNAKISTGAQGSVMSFQAAETALNAVFREASEVDQETAGHVVGYAVAQQGLGNIVIVERCVTTSDKYKQSACTNTDHADSRGITRAGSRTIVKGAGRPKVGEQIGGEGTKLQYFDFVSVAEGQVPGMNISNYNVQEFTTIAIAVAPEF